MICERWGVLRHDLFPFGENEQSFAEVYELANHPSAGPDGFLPYTEDYEHLDHIDTVATWHTHPRSDNKPSEEDLEAFRAYPRLVHYILGTNGLAGYEITINGEVIDYDCPPWLPEELMSTNAPVRGVHALGSLARAHEADPVLQGKVGA